MPKIEGGKPAGKKIKLVNRGAAGLLSTPKDGSQVAAVSDDEFLAALLKVHPEAAKAKITPQLRSAATDVGLLIPDPDNARLHPERNLRAIMTSLAVYGQRTPLVVNRKTMHVEKGNGTLAAAKSLGWRKIAAIFVDDDPATAAGYGLADNRTSELAAWNLEMVARLDKLISAAGGVSVGWSAAEIEVLRRGEWVEPPTDFPEVDESIEIEHQCPKCGYRFSGGETHAAESNGDGDGGEIDDPDLQEVEE